MDPESAENEACATSVGDVDAGFAAELDKVVLLEGESPKGEVVGDLGFGRTTLTRLELSLAGFSEKITNLRIFMMRLATMESEFEAFALVKDDIEHDSVEKVLEFDLLSGILDSEVRELNKLFGTLQTEIADTRERISSCTHLGEIFMVMKEKLCDFEEYVKQSEEQISVIKMQSVNFQRNLSSLKREENGNGEVDEVVREDDQSLNVTAEINMKTTEQQRNILRMLEKSLAREIELEKKLNDSIQIEEELKLRISLLEEVQVHVEEEATNVWESWFMADSASQILTGISKDILGRLQISQFNMNRVLQHESELREKVSSLEKQLKESEIQLLNTKASADEFQKLYNYLSSVVRDMEKLIVELKENASKAESRANNLEAECKLLSGSDTKMVDLLERQLKESDLQLQHAAASAEASQEKQSMLYSTIADMENVIKDLKSNVSKAESRADSAEDKCIILSESNAELNEELSFLRSRLECLEESLHREEAAKMATAKDIGMHIMKFKTLATQLAFERERLNKQISSLAFENKILIMKLGQTYKGPSQHTNNFNRDSCSSAGATKEGVHGTPDTGHKVERTRENSSANDIEMKPGDPMPDIGAVRRLDAGVLNFKHLFMAMLVLLLSAVTYMFLNDVNFDVSL